MRPSLKIKLRLFIIRSVCHNENGVVLVIGLMFLAILALLGTTAVVMTTTDMQIGGNYRSSVQAFNVAQAGLEVARYQLRTNIEASTTIDTMLEDSANGGVLSDSTSTNFFTTFYANGTFPDDLPLIAQTSFGGGTYRVYLTNDNDEPAPGVTSLTDTNNRVTLTSFGQGPANALVILQEVVQKLEVPPLPGAVVLPGPNVVFNGANSNASGIAGDTESAISTTSDIAKDSVVQDLTDINRIDNYTCEEGTGAGSDCITNDLAVMEASEPPMTTAAEIESVAATFLSAADTYLPGPGPHTLGPADVGTTSDRKIVFVDGDVTIGPSSGAGVLIVTGRLTLSGNVNYYGLILCIGKGELFRSGGGNGEVEGAIFVAKTRDTSGALLSPLGTPTFDTGGGGNTDIRHDDDQLRNATGAKFLKKSWQKI